LGHDSSRRRVGCDGVGVGEHSDWRKFCNDLNRLKGREMSERLLKTLG